MRIISGTHKGRRITAPKNLPVRPTTDRAKEALFNILQHRIDLYGVKALDLFAGIGSISFELSSRGCGDITSVDKHFGCVRFISETAESLELKGVHTVKSDVFQFLEQTAATFDFIFADPPYDLLQSAELADQIMAKGLLNAEGILIIEHSEEEDLSGCNGFTEHRRYGQVNFSIFEL